MSTPFIDAALSNLPASLCDLVASWSNAHPHNQEQLNTLVKFCLGAPCSYQSHQSEWAKGQTRLQNSLSNLLPNSVQNTGKHARDEDGENENKSSKKPKLSSEGDGDQTPLSILHSLSVTSPLRKKLNITITASSLLLTHPATGAVESSIPLSSLSRTFLVTNLGRNRNKPHWTTVLLSSDTWDKKNAASQTQVTFGVDHAPSNAKELFTTTTFPPGEPVSFNKGTRTLPHLKAFFEHFPDAIPLVIAAESNSSDDLGKAHTQIFRSSSGQPYVDAYRNAKEGSLYLLNTGVLWAESKPCEFFALEDIALDDDELGSGVRTLSATGRTLSIFVRRKGVIEKNEVDSDDEGSGGEIELVGEETEFAMVDGKEQENVIQWIRTFRRSFGKTKATVAPSAKTSTATSDPLQANGSPSKGKGKEKMTAEQARREAEGELLNSDTSDDDFVADSDEDGGEPSSDSSDDEDGEGGSGDEGSANDDEDGSEEGAGSERGSVEDEDQDDGDGAESEDEGELDPKHHPLLRPGAMPRMSKAAMEMSIKMVAQDLMGDDGDEEEGEDELEDD